MRARALRTWVWTAWTVSMAKIKVATAARLHARLEGGSGEVSERDGAGGDGAACAAGTAEHPSYDGLEGDGGETEAGGDFPSDGTASAVDGGAGLFCDDSGRCSDDGIDCGLDVEVYVKNIGGPLTGTFTRPSRTPTR